MPTPHNEAQVGDIAPKVLLPGDPLRAKYIADNYLDQVVRFNDVRNMYGYTGMHKGHKLSVMGSGMGGPSIGIYSYELYQFYNVTHIIRIGSLGAIQAKVNLGDIVIAQGAGSDSNFASQYQLPGILSAIPDWNMLAASIRLSSELKTSVHIGNVISSDFFYHAQKDIWKKWAEMGAIGLEMEAYVLYLTALHQKQKALTICTVSDSLVTGQSLSSDARESGFDNMIHLAINVLSHVD